jgi:hypothetical protein
MAQMFTVGLFHGLLEGGRRHSVAVLRDLNGHDEAMLAEMAQYATPAEQVSRLIAAVLVRMGETELLPVTVSHRLTVGDRERLLLAVCERVLGPRIDLVVTCTSASCGALSEIPIRFADAMGHDSAEPQSQRVVDLDAHGQTWRARCRPPTGADQERAARLRDHASRSLILDCVLELTDPSGQTIPTGDLPGAFEASIAEALLAFDSAAESRIAMNCPACGRPIDAVLDSYSILRMGVCGTPGIYDEVYRMARAYHWSEAEILSLPIDRRDAISRSPKGPRRTHEQLCRTSRVARCRSGASVRYRADAAAPDGGLRIRFGGSRSGDGSGDRGRHGHGSAESRSP